MAGSTACCEVRVYVSEGVWIALSAVGVVSRYDLHDPGASEECLTLNVWTLRTLNVASCVMVWIYGGGFREGGTSENRRMAVPCAPRCRDCFDELSLGILVFVHPS